VLEGDGLMSARSWYGERLNDWAERWTPYWTGDKGVFAMSAEEDSGILQALTQLTAARRASLDRVLILRAGSDYTVPPPGMSAADFLAHETNGGFPATPEALANLYAVASPIARFLADDWAHTKARAPA
jgi:purine nucleoside permease